MEIEAPAENRLGHIWDADTARDLRVVKAQKRTIFAKPENKAFKIPYWALDYAYLGGTRFRLDAAGGKWFTREADTFRLYAPGTMMWEDYSGAVFPRESLSLAFRAEAGNSVLSPVCARRFACFKDDTGKLRQLMLDIAEIGERRKDSGYWEALSKLSLIIDLLMNIEHLADENFLVASPRPGYSSAVATAIKTIEKHIASPLSLREIAGKANVSESTLSHRFAEETGRSPLVYRSELRIECAKRLLKFGESVKSVADQLGYCDIYHFSKSFKRATGATPSQLKRR